MRNIVDFIAEAGLLKRIARSGWWVIGIKDQESVADHCFRCAVLGFILAKMEKADPYKVLLMTLFNGDIGLTWKTGQETKVYFQDESGAHLRAISPVRIVGAQTAFAMTVHKSQGSEFETVIFVLPPRDIPLLTRELVYTAVTRAKKKVVVLGRKGVWLNAILNSCIRK